MNNSTDTNRGLQPHPNIVIPGHQATSYRPPPGPTLYGTWDEVDQPAGGEAEEEEDFMRPESRSPPSRRRPGQSREVQPEYCRHQSPAQRPVRMRNSFERIREARNQFRGNSTQRGTVPSSSSGVPLVRPAKPGVMMWDDAVQGHAEQLTGWDINDPEYPQTGSVRLVGKVPGDEYNLEELLDAVSKEIGAEPQDIALIDYTRLMETLDYSRALERQNRSLTRQLHMAGYEQAD